MKAVPIVAVTGLLALAGCTSAGRSANPRPSTSTTRPATSSPPGSSIATSTTVDPTVAAILAAYRASWAAFIAESNKVSPDPSDPELAKYDTGKELASAKAGLSRLVVRGHYDKGTTDLAPVVTSVEGDTAIVTDCAFDHSVEVDAKTGMPVESPDVGHTLGRFTLTRINGQWLVSDSTTLKSGKTEDACTPAA